MSPGYLERLAAVRSLPTRDRPVPTEHEEQVTVVDWWAVMHARYKLPVFALYAVANAGAGAQRGQAGKMKAEGVRPGIPDLVLAVVKSHLDDAYQRVIDCPGLYLEMKRTMGGRLSSEQVEVMAYLEAAGYRVVTCFGADHAIQAIKDYLG